MKVRWLAGFVLISMTASSAQGGGTIFRVPLTAFSEKNQRLPIGGVQFSPGAPAATAFTNFGVLLSGVDSSPVVAEFSIHLVPPSFARWVRNAPHEGDSSGKAFLIRFFRPARRVSVEMIADQPRAIPVLAQFSFRDSNGGLLGTEEIQLQDEPIVRRETDHPEGIAEITVDFGELPAAEVLSSLSFDYDPPFSIVTGVAQIAGFSSPDGTSLSTRLNLSGGQGGVVRLYGPGGEPLELLINGVLQNTFQFDGPKQETLTIEAPVNGSSFQGHAVIDWDNPGRVRTEFLVRDPGSSAAGDGSLPASHRIIAGASFPQLSHRFLIERDRGNQINTGIAVSNPTDTAIEIEMLIWQFESEEPEIEGQTPIVKLPLGPHEQLTFLVSDYCQRFALGVERSFCETDALSQADFRGEFSITSTRPVAVTVLLTQGGWPSSAIPIENLSSTFFSWNEGSN